MVYWLLYNGTTFRANIGDDKFEAERRDLFQGVWFSPIVFRLIVPRPKPNEWAD